MKPTFPILTVAFSTNTNLKDLPNTTESLASFIGEHIAAINKNDITRLTVTATISNPEAIDPKERSKSITRTYINE